MLTTSTAAAAVLADYLRCRQLAALAVGAITWAEYQQAMQV